MVVCFSLIKPEVLSELVTLITTEPTEDIPEQERYKHPNIACELLTTDIPSLTENLTKDISLLSKLYSFLEAEPPLNPLLASFFSRTMGVLVVRKTEQVSFILFYLIYAFILFDIIVLILFIIILMKRINPFTTIAFCTGLLY